MEEEKSQKEVMLTESSQKIRVHNASDDNVLVVPPANISKPAQPGVCLNPGQTSHEIEI